MSVAVVKALIIMYATIYNVSPTLALRICELESDFCVTAIGDNGRAHGLFQIHNNGEDSSWQIIRRAMGETPEDLRLDARENVRTAMYGIGVMGLGRWWSTFEQAKANVVKVGKLPSRESILGARLRRVQARYEGGA